MKNRAYISGPIVLVYSHPQDISGSQMYQQTLKWQFWICVCIYNGIFELVLLDAWISGSSYLVGGGVYT